MPSIISKSMFLKQREYYETHLMKCNTPFHYKDGMAIAYSPEHRYYLIDYWPDENAAMWTPVLARATIIPLCTAEERSVEPAFQILLAHRPEIDFVDVSDIWFYEDEVLPDP